MKNCQIIVKREDHHTVAYSFDDIRIALAIINILDNVAETHFDWVDGVCELQHIHKDISEV